MSLKDWMKKIESAQLNEFATTGQIQIKPASQMPKTPGQPAKPAGANNGQQPSPNTSGQQTGQQPDTNTNTQVITQGNKTLGTVNNPQLAQQIKQSIGKGEMTLGGTQLGEDEISEVAPPGMEDTVLALKKRFPGQEGRAYAIAWSNYNKKNGKKDTKESKMAEGKQLNEGTLDEILENYRYENKMCQEGWGMDNSLYEALADHYFKEGRIPRSVWHGSAEELREFVEDCYSKDTTVMGEGTHTQHALDLESDLKAQATNQPGTLNKVGSAIATTAKKVGNFIAPGDDELLSKLERETGGKRPNSYNESSIEEASELEQMLRKSTKESSMYESKMKKVSEATSVTDYNPKSAGGTRKELLAKYAKSGSSADATAARRAGATQDELKAAKAKCDDKKVTEATIKTKTGRIHKADSGGYGRVEDEADTDKDGKKIKKFKRDEPARGRGRPKKTDNVSGEDKKFDFSALTKTSGSKAPKDTKKGKVIKGKAQSHADNKKEEELDESRYNAQHQEFYAKNPGHAQGKEAVTVGGRIATKVMPKNKPGTVTKNRMTPFATKEVDEALKGGQKKLDINKNGKLDATDFAMLRNKKKKPDAQMESWDSQLKSILNERSMFAQGPTITPKVATGQVGAQAAMPQQGTGVNELLAILQNAGVGQTTPMPNAAGGNEIDGTELQSGVDGPVNDKNTEPGSKDPRNNPISGQVFVPQLAMPRGMGMSVEGDVHTHEIDVEPQDPEEVQVTLAKDNEIANADMEDIKDLLSRLIVDRDSGAKKAKLIVPYGDYAQEEGGETARDHQDVKQPNASVGVQGADDLDSIRQLAGTGGGILPANLEEDGDQAGTFENDSTFGHAVAEDETFGHATTAAGEEPTAMEEGDMANTFEGGRGKQTDVDLVSSLMEKLNAMLGRIDEADKKPDFLDLDKDGDKEEPMTDATDDKGEEKDDDKEEEDDKENDSEDKEKVKEGSQSCNECGGLMEDDHECGQLNEWANSPGGKTEDESFIADMDFMTKVISGGLNGRKSTGQTTTPVLASQTKRQETKVSEGYNIDVAAEMRKLAGIK